MEDGPPMFRQNSTCSALLKLYKKTLLLRDYHPLWHTFPDDLNYSFRRDWPGPRSLAATSRVSFDFLSSGYLDVSIRRVCFLFLCIQNRILLNAVGSPIQRSTDQKLFALPRRLSQRTTSFIAS